MGQALHGSATTLSGVDRDVALEIFLASHANTDGHQFRRRTTADDR